MWKKDYKLNQHMVQGRIKPAPHWWEPSTLTTVPFLLLSVVLRLWTIYFDTHIFILTLRTMAVSLFSPRQWIFLFLLHQPLHLDLVAVVGNQSLSFQWNPWKYLIMSHTASAWWKPDRKILNDRYVRQSSQLHVWKSQHLRNAFRVYIFDVKTKTIIIHPLKQYCSWMKHLEWHCSWHCRS